MQVVAERDPRAVATTAAFHSRHHERTRRDGEHPDGFPWAAGVLATVLARQDQGEAAWSVLESIRPTICSFGGMTEVMEKGAWNMQYFGTAQGACCTALHSLLLQSRNGEIHLFPAVPPAWPEARFERLLAAGLAVSGEYARGQAAGAVRNETGQPLERTVVCGGRRESFRLEPGEERRV
jgi:hypothetical protein